MSYPATVFRVMIASPSDVDEERKLAREIIFGWNSIHSEDKQMVLLPLGWEHDSYPLMGDHPQGIINKELLERADIKRGFDQEQLNKLEEFKKSCQDRGLYHSYKDIDDFKDKFSGHLQMLVNNDECFENERKLTDPEELDLSNLFSNDEEEDLREEAVTLLRAATENGDGHFTKHGDLSGWSMLLVFPPDPSN